MAFASRLPFPVFGCCRGSSYGGDISAHAPGRLPPARAVWSRLPRLRQSRVRAVDRSSIRGPQIHDPREHCRSLMMTASMTRRRFNTTLGLASMAAVGAFGGATGAAAAESTLNFQSIWLNDPEFLGYMIAIDKGYYAEEGLKVNYLPGGPNLIPEGSLLAGKADIALTNMLTTAKAVVEKGAALKVIGTQYQKSPAGFISLAATGISQPKDLVGKTVAVSTLASSTVRAFLKLHGIAEDKLRIVPYAFNPAPLINGEVDAVVDFVTQLPFLVEKASGKKVQTFLIYDYGLEFYIDLVVVSEQTLNTKRAELIRFMRASRKGWKENFADPTKYAGLYHDTWFKGTGSTLDAETFFNTTQLALMDHPQGLYTMTEEGIQRNIEALAKLGIEARRGLFDTTLLAEI
jgi:ABC-type nitrate/sulfonate/bicarbonate transport system substrate-binding protein